MKKKIFKYDVLIFFIIGLLIIFPKTVSAEEEKYKCVYKFNDVPCGNCGLLGGITEDYPPKCLTEEKCSMTVEFSIYEGGTTSEPTQSWDNGKQKPKVSLKYDTPYIKCKDEGACFNNYYFETCPSSLNVMISGRGDLFMYPLSPNFTLPSSYSDRMYTGILNAEESDLGSDNCEFSDSEIESSINNIKSKQEELRALLNDLESAIANKTLTNESLEEQKKKIESVDREIKSIYTNGQNNYGACQKWIDYIGSGEYDRIKGELYNISSSLNDAIQNLDNISTKNKNDFGTIVNDMNKEYNSGISEGDLSGCGVLPQSMISIIRDATKMIQIGVPILLIVLGTVDFAKAIMVNDQDAIKKAGTSFGKRCVAGIIIFFLPILINLIFQMDGIKDLPGIKDMVDPLCRQ